MENQENIVNPDLLDKMAAALMEAYEPDENGIVTTGEIHEAMMAHWPAPGLTADVVADALNRRFAFGYEPGMKQFVWRIRPK